MEIAFTKADGETTFPRIYGIDAVLKNFKGCQHLEITLFRHGASDEELAALQGLQLVGGPDPDVPPEVLQGATEENAYAFRWRILQVRKWNSFSPIWKSAMEIS